MHQVQEERMWTASLDSCIHCNIKEKFVRQNIHRCIHFGMMQSARREVKSDEKWWAYYCALFWGANDTFLPIGSEPLKNIQVLIMHKASLKMQVNHQNGFPIEMNYSPIHRDEKTYRWDFPHFELNRSRCYEEEKNMRKKKNGCTSLAKVHFLYIVETSSVGVCLQCCQI